MIQRRRKADPIDRAGANIGNIDGKLRKNGHDPASADEKMDVMYNLTLKWAQQLEQSRIIEYTELLRHPWSLIWRNVLAGTARGIGIAIGFTFFAATIIYILQILGALNLPIIGDYIADIVRIVQRQLELNTY